MCSSLKFLSLSPNFVVSYASVPSGTRTRARLFFLLVSIASSYLLVWIGFTVPSCRAMEQNRDREAAMTPDERVEETRWRADYVMNFGQCRGKPLNWIWSEKKELLLAYINTGVASNRVLLRRAMGEAGIWEEAVEQAARIRWQKAADLVVATSQSEPPQDVPANPMSNAHQATARSKRKRAKAHQFVPALSKRKRAKTHP